MGIHLNTLELHWARPCLWCILLLIEILEGTPSISELVVVYYIIVLI